MAHPATERPTVKEEGKEGRKDRREGSTAKEGTEGSTVTEGAERREDMNGKKKCGRHGRKGREVER